eukprot:s5893_g2.t2
MPRIPRASLAARPEVLRSLALVGVCAAWDLALRFSAGFVGGRAPSARCEFRSDSQCSLGLRRLGSSTDQAAVGRLRIARRIKTYDAFENMGEPIDVYSTFFGVSVLMLVVLFVIPFATKFGRSEEEAEDEEAELLYEEVEDEEDLFEPEEEEASQEEVTDDKVVAKAEKAGIGSVSENPDQAAVPVHLADLNFPGPMQPLAVSQAPFLGTPTRSQSVKASPGFLIGRPCSSAEKKHATPQRD